MLQISVRLFGTTFTKKADAKLRFHRSLNLKDPVTLADKLCYIELYRDEPLKSICSDKYAVRSYVTEKGLQGILIPLLTEPINTPADFHFEELPEQFVLKAADGCGMNYICPDKREADPVQVKKMITRWLKEGYPRACIEPHYLKIPHRVICEQLLPDAEHIIDYKIHCFHGSPDFILACGNRVQGVKKRIYSTDWVFIDAVVGNERADFDFDKPINLDRMLEISRILSADFDFVRVDLYDIRGRIYFGELTFSPASGVLPNFSKEFVAEKGIMLRL